MISKTLLQVKKKLQKEENNQECVHVYSMSMLKNAEIFSSLELPGIEHVLYFKKKTIILFTVIVFL